MPIYEFHCEKCDKESEILVRSNDWQGTRCPNCGSTKLSKKFSVFASSGGAAPQGGACETRGGRAGGGGCGGCCGGGPHRH